MSKSRKWNYEQDVLCVKRYAWFVIKKDKLSLEKHPEIYNCECFKAIEKCDNISDLVNIIANDIPEIPKDDILRKIRKIKKIFLEWGLDNIDDPKPLSGYTKQMLIAADDYLTYRFNHDIDGTEVVTKAMHDEKLKQEYEKQLKSKDIIICQDDF